MTKRVRTKVRVPWWQVPKHMLIDYIECTGLDPTKVKWEFDVETDDWR